MQTIKEKTSINLVLKARIKAFGQKIEQNNRYTDLLKSCGSLKGFKTANFETQNLKMKFSILTEVTVSLINACKVEERDSNSLQNGKPSHFNRILTENRSKTIPGWRTEACFCPFTLKDRN